MNSRFSFVCAVLISALGLAQCESYGEPFLIRGNKETYVIGNDLWNVTVGPTFATKLLYKGVNLVGNASGHYVSYSTSPKLSLTPF